MRPETSRLAFERFVEARGSRITALTAGQGVRLMLEFYREVRTEGVRELDEGGDTLLFEWGIFDWGKGERFQITICRQFVDAALQDDDAISQLRLVFYFARTEDLRQLKDGARWCDQPKWLAEFETFIRDNTAYQAVATSYAEAIELTYGRN